MNWALFLGGLAGLMRGGNTPAQQSIASAAFGVGLFRLTQPGKER